MDNACKEHDHEHEIQWRDELNTRYITMMDADEVCLLFLDDLLTGIFQEMQVRAENLALFSIPARQLCVQLFESLNVSALKPSPSLDQSPDRWYTRDQSNILQYDPQLGDLSSDCSKSALQLLDSSHLEVGESIWTKEETPPQSIEIDRQVPGQIGKKASTNAVERAMKRKVLLQMPRRQGSRWKTVQNKVVTDLGIKLTRDNATKRSARSVSSENDADQPKAVTSANIFSLDKPQEVLSHETACRQDLSTQAEQEVARRTITTKSALLSINKSPLGNPDALGISSRGECQVSYANVRAKSIVTLGVESLSPTRPLQGRKNVKNPRSKFELERKPLLFAISDCVQEEPDERHAAVCSPIQQSCPFSLPESLKPEPPLPMLPLLNSSSLAVGVKAVVGGVEIRGPKRYPSRNVRLRLHNYRLSEKELSSSDHDLADCGHVPFSPVQTSAVRDEDSYRLPILPLMSPIKANPLKHVTLKSQNYDGMKGRMTRISPKSHVRQRPVPKVKQQVWESSNPSPPRVRNYHFASGKSFRKIFFSHDNDEELSCVKLQEDERENDYQSLVAPRRNDLPVVDLFNSELLADYDCDNNF
ncbi:uncharacterized protein PHALS_10464 [Plasmopara halstedii]|uniref:Uncharacterized protein n=1 Tax=Plasmopara halstedii TaxID=4781 RepID=A0A0P1AH75_PLAHL|nr:uncharacterized protein PHALS_10464 [Plasmopara halstedii]CEG40252.1 hypothetical protein PHALS_10464 [Plasmopara halstedii]|eukprot:XP_024576621.1 hypothetical protein PHALS_10464 [Plasmopara halstedii]